MFCRKLFIAAWLLTLIASTGAFAASLVDTGPGSVVLNGYPNGYPYGYVLQPQPFPQFAAGRIHLTDSYTLTRIDGWMATPGSAGGQIEIVIRNADLNADVPTDVVASAGVFNIGASVNPGWYGLDNLNILLPANYYWVSFEDVSGDANMSMTGWAGVPLAHPLESYRFYYGDPASWHQYGGMYGSAFGLQIDGTLTNAIPEPETYAMLLAGLGLLGFAVRRRRRKAA